MRADRASARAVTSGSSGTALRVARLLPRMLRLTPANAFGCFCINAVLVGLSIALIRLCSMTILYGRLVF